MYGFDVFAFSETWLNSSVSNDSILIPGYSLPLKKDRLGKRGGGVAIYAKDHIAVKRRVEFEYSAGLNGTLSNADWNDFDPALFDIDVIYQRFFPLLLSTVESFISHKKVII